jgi:hypothetical protein
MDSVIKIVEKSQRELKTRLDELLRKQGKFEVEQYARFLTMQFYLTQDVQQEFYNMAGNKDFIRRKSLRKFLVKFAEEEEPHYMIAKKDLENLNLVPGPKPLDVYFWKIFFEKQVLERPFLRIGATCVLENIANTSNKEILSLVDSTPELNSSNTQFLRIHLHGPELPHGDEVFEAVSNITLSESELSDLEIGARIGKKIYLQLVDWIITGEE